MSNVIADFRPMHSVSKSPLKVYKPLIFLQREKYRHASGFFQNSYKVNSSNLSEQTLRQYFITFIITGITTKTTSVIFLVTNSRDI